MGVCVGLRLYRRRERFPVETDRSSHVLKSANVSEKIRDDLFRKQANVGDISGLLAQSAGNGGTISGTVTDPTGAVVPSADVKLKTRSAATTGRPHPTAARHFQFTNVPLNPYHLVVSAKGFASRAEDVDVRSTVPVTVKSTLTIGESSTVVERHRRAI